MECIPCYAFNLKCTAASLNLAVSRHNFYVLPFFEVDIPTKHENNFPVAGLSCLPQCYLTANIEQGPLPRLTYFDHLLFPKGRRNNHSCPAVPFSERLTEQLVLCGFGVDHWIVRLATSVLVGTIEIGSASTAWRISVSTILVANMAAIPEMCLHSGCRNGPKRWGHGESKSLLDSQVREDDRHGAGH